MKITIKLPDSILREAKAVAASRRKSVSEFVEEALREHLARQDGWREVFGTAPKGATNEVDAIIEAECGQIELETWR